MPGNWQEGRRGGGGGGRGGVEEIGDGYLVKSMFVEQVFDLSEGHDLENMGRKFSGL